MDKKERGDTKKIDKTIATLKESCTFVLMNKNDPFLLTGSSTLKRSKYQAFTTLIIEIRNSYLLKNHESGSLLLIK